MEQHRCIVVFFDRFYFAKRQLIICLQKDNYLSHRAASFIVYARLQKKFHCIAVLLYITVRGVIMVLDMGCEFRDCGSIPSECQIPRDVDLGQYTIGKISVTSIM